MIREHPLGRRVSPDDLHLLKYPLSAAPQPPPSGLVPVVFGLNWYSGFDVPIKHDGRWWIGRGDWGSVRGGHAICARPFHVADTAGWHEFYNQGAIGACVGYSESRMLSLLYRIRFDALSLYSAAQKVDEWSDTPPQEGTSVRAGFDVLRASGAVVNHTTTPDARYRITANRWALSADEVLRVLGYESYGAIPLLQSWGTSYPETVWISAEGIDRLLRENGEAAVPVRG